MKDISPFLNKVEDYLELVNVDNHKPHSKKTTVFSKYRSIKTIKKVEMVPTKCLAVENNCHTYLISDNFIKTHNTDRVLSFESFKEFDPVIKRRVPKYFKEPISGLELCNYNKYCLQLSVYALMLEQFRFKLSQEEDALQIKHITTERDEKGDHVLDANGNPTMLKEDVYNLPYLKEEAKAILNYYLNLNTL
jgi:hypothetical protein